jgi:hypothetical protein
MKERENREVRSGKARITAAERSNLVSLSLLFFLYTGLQVAQQKTLLANHTFPHLKCGPKDWTMPPIEVK